MNYEQASEWVHSLPRISDTPKLEKMGALLAALGNPHRRLRFVHIAGTNGKGSTVVMLSSILTRAGYKVGANVSPYIVDFRERFQINGQMITEARLAEVLSLVRSAIETMPQPYIEFEAVTAAALCFFAQENCDIVCMETGIGGRLDATNIIENTLVACITKIGLDHTEMLGTTLRKIAAEKCGIFKNQCDVISYPAQDTAAAEVIEEFAGKAGCTLTVPSIEDFRFYKGQPFENRMEYGGYEINVPFIGPHQALNASVALEAALCLWRQGFTIEDEHIIQGIERASIPARIEVISNTPLIIVDGAHNEDSAKALASTLRLHKLDNLCAVVGILRDKNAGNMIQVLAPFIKTAFTVAPDSPRAMSADELAAVARRYISEAEPCTSVAEAMQMALEEKAEGVIVFGSLYLAAEVRKLIPN